MDHSPTVSLSPSSDASYTPELALHHEPHVDSPLVSVHTLIDLYQNPLQRYATHLLGDPSRAQDVVQDTFAKHCDHPPPAELSRPENSGRLKAWLFTVCRNRAFDVMKKEHRMKQLTAPMNESQTSPTPSPAVVAEQRDTHAAVLDRLTALPEQQQEVVRLKFQADLSYRQIAEVTGLTVSNVGYLLHHALKTLRTQLATLD